MTTPDRDGELPRRRGRSVPAIYGIVSLVLVVGAMTFALSTPPPNTPPLAAVAPAPQEQLEVERVQQSSQFGEGTGGEGACVPGDPGCGGVGEEPPTAEQPDVPGEAPAAQGDPEVVETRAPGRFRRCYNGGLTQSPDPQSPPCVPEVFSGDNGAATAPGVSATEIRIGYDASGEGGPVEGYHLDLFGEHFRRYYELYGRGFTFVPLDLSGDREKPDVQRAHATQVANADVFAVTAYYSFGAYQSALADAGVITLVDAFDLGPIPEADLSRLHPFVWSVTPSLEESFTISGEVICGSLAGQPARHGGDEVRERPRVFGLFVESPNGDGVHYDPTILVNAMESCGAPYVIETYEDGRTDTEIVLRRFREAGVTTVVCACANLPRRYTDSADAIGFEPEWFLPGISDRHVRSRTNATSFRGEHLRNQLAHVFGVGATLRLPSVSSTSGPRLDEYFWYHAATEVDPGYDCGAGTGNCQRPPSYYSTYAQLLILASGIQAAGPELTPQTFGDGLTALRYPNPGVGAPPWWQPSVGFGARDHGFNSDFSLYWWRDADDAGWESGTDHGEVCYVGGGTRYRSGGLPRDADSLLFNPEAGCR